MLTIGGVGTGWKPVVRVCVVGLLAMGVLFCESRRASAEDKKPQTPLGKAMEQIDNGMKKLRRSLRSKEANAQSLETIAKVEQAVLDSKAMTPSRTTTMPSDQQPAFVSDYHKRMAALLISMCNMETAVLDGDNAKAQEIYKQLKQQEEDGHDQFMPSDSDAAK